MPAPHNLPDFLKSIRVRNAGPFQDFTVNFHHPVTVIAGPNGSGKSTVLLAASSAYHPAHHPSAGLYDPLVPRLSRHTAGWDEDSAPSLTFTYAMADHPDTKPITLRHSMTASTTKDPDGCRPDLPTYIRTHGHLSSIPLDPDPDPDQPTYAAGILNRVLGKDYLAIKTHRDDRGHPEPAAVRPSGALHTLDHMSYGEAVVTRLAYDLTRFHGGLALIDLIETGLHPVAARELVKDVLRLSRSNNTQFILTTHSPEVAATLPEEANIFLPPRA